MKWKRKYDDTGITFVPPRPYKPEIEIAEEDMYRWNMWREAAFYKPHFTWVNPPLVYYQPVLNQNTRTI